MTSGSGTSYTSAADWRPLKFINTALRIREPMLHKLWYCKYRNRLRRFDVTHPFLSQIACHMGQVFQNCRILLTISDRILKKKKNFPFECWVSNNIIYFRLCNQKYRFIHHHGKMFVLWHWLLGATYRRGIGCSTLVKIMWFYICV